MIEKKSITKTFFLEVMGDNPLNKILDFLIENERESWTLVEISKFSKVGYSTLKLIMPKMENNGLVKITKKVGKSNLYTINKENPIVKKIYGLYNQILQERV